MISLHHAIRVFLHAPPTDLRKGFDALSGLVTSVFGQDLTCGHLFLVSALRRPHGSALSIIAVPAGIVIRVPGWTNDLPRVGC